MILLARWEIAMTQVSVEDARSFLLSTDLSDIKRPTSGAGLLDDTTPSFDQNQNQAVVVGSGVLTLARGVSADRRAAIMNALLLAQLVLKQKQVDPKNVTEWYRAYCAVLANLGWTIETKTDTQTVQGSTEFEAHQAILQVASLLLGPGTTALALVATTLNAMASVDASTPWIKIFSRETNRANASNFQMALVEQTPDGQSGVSLMAFSLEATTTLDQVLFFKAHVSAVEFVCTSSTATINGDVLDTIADDLRKKVLKYSTDYVSQLDL